VRGKRSTKAKVLAGDGPLARVPPLVVFVVVAGLFAAGVIVGGLTGALLLGVLAVGVGVLLAATWPVLTSSQRAGRVLVFAVLVAVAVSVLLTK
jgi:uncharacterized protein DUF6703